MIRSSSQSRRQDEAGDFKQPPIPNHCIGNTDTVSPHGLKKQHASTGDIPAASLNDSSGSRDQREMPANDTISARSFGERPPSSEDTFGGQERFPNYGQFSDKFVQLEKGVSLPGRSEIQTSSRQEIQPGAVCIGEIDANLSVPDEENPDPQTDIAASMTDLAIAAEVAPNEEEIEAQVQARIQEEREEIAAQAQNRLLNQAVHADILEPEDLQGIKMQLTKRKLVLLGLLASAIIAIVVTVSVLVAREDGAGTCTLCADGFVPEDMGAEQFTLGGDSVTCANITAMQNDFDASSDSCKGLQAVAWRHCGCPSLPPSPLDASCSLNFNGTLPVIDPERIVHENRTCSDWDTFVAHLESSPWYGCDVLMDEFMNVAHVCASDMAFVQSLENLLLPASGEAIRLEGTPEYQALYWLATHPADLNITTDTEAFQQRYAAALLYFATRGPSWENPCGFLSNESICSWSDEFKEGQLENLQNLGFDFKRCGLFCDGEGVVESIILPWNKLNGTIPSELTLLSGLQTLVIATNMITGSIPQDFGDLTKLEFVTLEENFLTGEIPSAFFNLQMLTSLSLDFNSFSWGALPTSFGNASALGYFTCASCSLNGMIPESIGRLAHLYELDLGLNSLTGQLPSFSENTMLEHLWLDNNYLAGTLPASLGGLSNLLSFNVSFNLLKGPIPEAIGNLSHVKMIDLSGNHLTGHIPTWLGNLVTVEELWLYHAGLSGAIPTELGRMVELKGLTLRENALSGTVPAELRNCSSLERLSVGMCGLIGSFPSTVASLSTLGYLVINGNNFTNDYDETFCTRAEPFEILRADCLVETVDCPCCTSCCDAEGLNCT